MDQELYALIPHSRLLSDKCIVYKMRIFYVSVCIIILLQMIPVSHLHITYA